MGILIKFLPYVFHPSNVIWSIPYVVAKALCRVSQTISLLKQKDARGTVHLNYAIYIQSENTSTTKPMRLTMEGEITFVVILTHKNSTITYAFSLHIPLNMCIPSGGFQTKVLENCFTVMVETKKIFFRRWICMKEAIPEIRDF
jgi:hypothetical protein